VQADKTAGSGLVPDHKRPFDHQTLKRKKETTTMAEQENKITQDNSTDEKLQELFALMDEKAAAGELNEVEDDESFKKELEENASPMTESEASAYEYSMMMQQYEAMLADYQRREAEEKAAQKAAEKDAE
jgi:hypothetical protein